MSLKRITKFFSPKITRKQHVKSEEKNLKESSIDKPDSKGTINIPILIVPVETDENLTILQENDKEVSINLNDVTIFSDSDNLALNQSIGNNETIRQDFVEDKISVISTDGDPTEHEILIADNKETEIKNFLNGSIINTNLVSNEKPKKSISRMSSLKITEFFKIRRSTRKTERTIKQIKYENLIKKISEHMDQDLAICDFDEKGRGIVAKKKFEATDFVVEYVGELLSHKEAKKREKAYSKDENIGCYMYYFRHGGKSHCIDATNESERFGRLINHSSKESNLKAKSITIAGKPRIYFIATKEIEIDKQLLFDYGDRSKKSLFHNPWLKN